MTSVRCFFVALLCLFALPAIAAEDLLDIYRQAVHHDPDLASARAGAGAADARYRQARGQLLPQLSGSGSFSKVKQEQSFEGGNPLPGGNEGDPGRDDGFQDQQSLTLDLSQALFDWSAWQARDAAAVRRDQQETHLAFARSDLMLRTASAYFDVLAARSAAAVAERQQAVIERQRDRAQAAFDAGLEPITDLQQAQSQLDSVLVDSISARNALANSRDALGNLTGSSHPALADAATPYRVSVPEGTADEWVTRALQGNPEPAERRLALAAAREDIGQARGGHYPTLGLTASLGESERIVDFGAGNTRQVTDTQSVGLELRVPLFAGGATAAAVDEAGFVAAQAEQEWIRTRRQIAADTRGALRNLEAAVARVQALDKAIASASTAVEAARAGQRTGTRNILDVLEAELDHIQRQADRQQAWYDYAVAGLRLKQAAGTLRGADLQRINARLNASEADVEADPDVPRPES